MKKTVIPFIILIFVLLTGCTSKEIINSTQQNVPTTSEVTTSAPATSSTTTKVPTTTTKTASSTTTKVPTTTTQTTSFNNYGYDVITVSTSKYTISYTGLYTSKEEVGIYIYTYKKLPTNFKKKSQFNKSDYTSQNKLSVGGDRFYNNEKRLPTTGNRTYTECDIDYKGGSRNAKRIVYSSDFLIFYTADHYDSFSIMRFI